MGQGLGRHSVHMGEEFIYTHLREDAFEVRVGIQDISRENEEVGQSIFIGVRVRDRGRQIEACRG